MQIISRPFEVQKINKMQSNTSGTTLKIQHSKFWNKLFTNKANNLHTHNACICQSWMDAISVTREIQLGIYMLMQ